MFFLVIIVTVSIVFRIIIYFIHDLLKQTNDIITTIFVIKLILLFYAFFRIFNVTVESFTQVEIAFI